MVVAFGFAEAAGHVLDGWAVGVIRADEGSTFDRVLAVFLADGVNGRVQLGELLYVLFLEERVLAHGFVCGLARMNAEQADWVSIPKLVKKPTYVMIDFVGDIC